MRPNSGDRNSSAARATARSKAALISRRQPVNSGWSTCSSGRPATGRMWSAARRPPSAPGATNRSVSVFSSSQARSRSRAPLISGQDSTATVSASYRSHHVGHAVQAADDRHGRSRPARTGAAHAGGHDGSGRDGLAAQHGGQVGDHVRVPDGHDLAHAAAERSQLVQPLTQRNRPTGSSAVRTAGRRRHSRGPRRSWSRTTTIATRRSGRSRRSAPGGTRLSHPDEPRVVPPGQTDRDHPQHGQREAEQDVRGPVPDSILEADLKGQQAGSEAADQIGDGLAQ